MQKFVDYIVGLIHKVLTKLGIGEQMRYSIIRYSFNTGWMFAEKVITLPVSLLTGIYIARYLGPDLLGILSYSQSYVALFAVIASLGIDSILIKELVLNPEKKEQLLGSAFFLKLITFGIFITTILLSFNVINNAPATKLLIFIISGSYFFNTIRILEVYFQWKVKLKYAAISRLISTLIISTIKIILVINSASLELFAACIVLESLIAVVILIFFYRKLNEKLVLWKLSITLAIKLLKQSAAIAIASLSTSIMAYIDQVMLGQLSTANEVGQYSIAITIINMTTFIPVAVIQSFHPAVTNGKNISEKVYTERILQLYRIMFAIFIIVAIPISIFSPLVIGSLFGAEFERAGFLLSILSIRLFFANIGMVRNIYLINENLLRFLMITAIIGAIANISFNYLLIPQLDALGAIIATILSFFLSIFLFDLFFNKTKKNLLLMMRGILSFYKLNINNS